MDIKLRSMTVDDLPFLLEIRNECRHMLHDNREFTLEQCKDWWNFFTPKFFCICLKDDTKVGYVRTSEWNEDHHHAYIGIDIASQHRRKGYAQQAYRLMLDALFTSGMNKVSLEVLANNEPAIALYKKMGFIQEGIKRQDILRDGNYLDSIVMSILKSEWYGQK